MRPVCAGVRWLLLLSCVLFLSLANARDIEITSASNRVENGMLLLNADATFEFSEDARRALDSGIPLTIQLEVRVARVRHYVWDVQLVRTRRKLVIEHHALSSQFLITDQTTGERRTFGSLDAAITDLGRIHSLPLSEASLLGAQDDYQISLRLWLDLRSLPGPLIPVAYVSPAWHMSSGWYRWPMQR